jgi:hypothetical protein
MIELLATLLGVSLMANFILHTQYRYWRDSARLFQAWIQDAYLEEVRRKGEGNNVIQLPSTKK